MTSRPRLLDLFCGAGGAAVGYHRAGFDVVGVDIKPQPRYPFQFILGDALTFQEFGDVDAIHASPPCQAHIKGLGAVNRSLGRTNGHADLIGQTRDRLTATGLPFVIENVVGAPLVNPIRLCGSAFGLDVERHRLFECSGFSAMSLPCAHHTQRPGRFWTAWRPKGQERRSRVVQVYGNAADRHQWGPAMGIDWMTPDELAEAIPPAYTEWIGYYLLASVKVAA